MKPTSITEAIYCDAVDNYLGWCTECQDFTRDMTEPDARRYDCPDCEQNTVYGAEEALLCGLFTLRD